MTEPWAWDATRTAAAIRAGEITAREVAEATLSRIYTVNPALNALVAVTGDEALAAADAADAAVRAGGPVGPLHGVPVTIKVNVDQKGQATTNGIRPQAGTIASADAPLVANLRRAGAVIVGRTNTPAFSLRWFIVRPWRALSVNQRSEKAGVFVRPTITAPARRRFATSG
ncbi:MAG: amidase family protein, partial [Pseudomonadota bacterium]